MTGTESEMSRLNRADSTELHVENLAGIQQQPATELDDPTTRQKASLARDQTAAQTASVKSFSWPSMSVMASAASLGVDVASMATRVSFDVAKFGTNLGLGIAKGVIDGARWGIEQTSGIASNDFAIDASSFATPAIMALDLTTSSLDFAQFIAGTSIGVSQSATTYALDTSRSAVNILQQLYGSDSDTAKCLGNFGKLVAREWEAGGLGNIEVWRVVSAVAAWAAIQYVTHERWLEHDILPSVRFVAHVPRIDDSNGKEPREQEADEDVVIEDVVTEQQNVNLAADILNKSADGQARTSKYHNQAIVEATLQQNSDHSSDDLSPFSHQNPPESNKDIDHLLHALKRYSKFSLGAYGHQYMSLFGVATEPEQPFTDTEDTSQKFSKHHISFAYHAEHHPSSVWTFTNELRPSQSASSENADSYPSYYIITDDAQKLVILALRGTFSLNDLAIDFTCEYTRIRLPCDGPDTTNEYWVHSGIYRSAMNITRSKALMRSLSESFRKHRGYGLCIVGHSLGAGIGSLLGCLLANVESCTTLFANASGDPDVQLPPNIPIHVYAFGAPCVGDTALSARCHRLITSVVVGWDLVPRLCLGSVQNLVTASKVLLDDNMAGNSMDPDGQQTQPDNAKTIAQIYRDVLSYRELPQHEGPDTAKADLEDWYAAKRRLLEAEMTAETLVPAGSIYWLLPHRDVTSTRQSYSLYLIEKYNPSLTQIAIAVAGSLLPKVDKFYLNLNISDWAWYDYCRHYDHATLQMIYPNYILGGELKEASFKEYITDSDKPPSTGSTNTISSFLSRTIRAVTAPSAPSFEYSDFIFFAVSKLSDGSATYLGLAGQWFVWQEIQGRTARLRRHHGDAEGSSVGVDAEGAAEGDKARAIKAKLTKDYVTAGELYAKAARRLENLSEDANRMDAATLHEDAYKAYKAAKTPHANTLALQHLEKAASLIEGIGRYLSRAGTLYQQAADFCLQSVGANQGDKSQEMSRATMLYESALRCYTADDDGRSIPVSAALAELYLRRRLPDKALPLYKDSILAASSEPTRQFRVKDYLFGWALCILANTSGREVAWEELDSEMEQWRIEYGTFWNSTQDLYDPGERELGQRLLDAISAGKLEEAKDILKDGADLVYRDEHGKTPLHYAAQHGHLDIVQWLLSERHPYNVVDYRDVTAGDLARENGHSTIYEALLNEGCRAELILRMISGGRDPEDTPNEDYLTQKLHYSDNRLMDENNDAVMMGWEGPLMIEHAKVMCTVPNPTVLNVGFGLGLIDDALQTYHPSKHVIIEAHPDVYQHMLDLGWDKKEGVQIRFGRWQEVVEDLHMTFDGIFFDTYGEFYEDLHAFHEHVPNLLNPGGTYTFFNGLGATNQFFHDIYCRISEIDLKELGLGCEWVEMDVPSAGEDGVWEDVRQSKGDDEGALKLCEQVLAFEPGNYNALVFAGLALQHLSRLSESEKSYKKAIECNENQVLAWQGLAQLYEKTSRFGEYVAALERLVALHSENDIKKAVETFRKILEVYRVKARDDGKLVTTLKFSLPEGPYGSAIASASNLTPIEIWKEIAGIQERHDHEVIEREIAARKHRLGAGTPSEVRQTVLREVYARSELGDTYEHLLALLDDQKDAQLKQEVESKTVHFLDAKLDTTGDNKEKLREQLLSLSKKIVSQRSNDPLPYEIIIENTNTDHPDGYDGNDLHQYVSKFPESPLGKVIAVQTSLAADDDGTEALKVFEETIEALPNSLYAHQCILWVYHRQQDHENVLEYATRLLQLVKKDSQKYGRVLDKVEISAMLCMADAYRLLGESNHSKATALYDRILCKDPGYVKALEGKGFLLSSDKEYDEAMAIFENVLALHPDNAMAKSEIGWLYGEQGDLASALQNIQEAIDMDNQNALHVFRLGKIYWGMDDVHRQDKEYAYMQFITAAKLDPSFGPAFTCLGDYYRDVAQDRQRAKKCYQKAFSLDLTDQRAAMQLSDYYIEDEEYDQAELVLRTCLDVNSRVPWAWKRLGFLDLHNGHDHEAISHFQSALRLNSDDPQCWEGLADGYQNEGRTIAALRAYSRAKQLASSPVYAQIQIANVERRLGLLVDSIEHGKEAISLASSHQEIALLPAYYGLVRSYLDYATETREQGFYGRSADACGDALRTLAEAIGHDANVQCLWKAAGDACTRLFAVSHYDVNVPWENLRDLIGQILEKNVSHPISGTQGMLEQVKDFKTSSNSHSANIILCCASVAFYRALALAPRGAPNVHAACWYDLGLVYYEIQQLDKDETLLQTAVGCLLRATKLDPEHIGAWNALGVATMHANPKLSQRALISAMELDPRSAIPYTNYGFLALFQSDLELANKSFSHAQSLDPDWMRAWCGQACIARLWGSHEIVELFSHVVEVGDAELAEGNYGLAQAVFEDISQGHASSELITLSAFAMQKYTEQRPEDVEGINLYGLLLERIDQSEQAAAMFKRAREADASASAVRQYTFVFNLARAQCAASQFEEAIETYGQVMAIHQRLSDADSLPIPIVYAYLGAGTAYYFCDQLQEALEMFEMALQETEADESALRPQVILLLTQILTALGSEEHLALARDHLLNAVHKWPQQWEMPACLVAIGLHVSLMEDIAREEAQEWQVVAQAAAAELGKFLAPTSPVPLAIHDAIWVAQLLAQFSGAHILQHFVHRYPFDRRTWMILSQSHANPSIAQTAVAMFIRAIWAEDGTDQVPADEVAEVHAQWASTLTDADAAKAALQKALFVAPWLQ
ncbi:hypothetical protein BZG36_01672 [Bifiguratus adelaidae]|uniref:RMT2 domain-containing protein n=1 Tax=Bifiguratus adelaidae TaxID=1938954 RepID=A0A261Y4K4_9FUNG|nr:hypothetical protein BZG36_01672 [Bifiguratus adelaidae]